MKKPGRWQDDISRLVGKIFQTLTGMEINYRGHTFQIDYRVIPMLRNYGKITPIFHYPGTTSGWEWASELPFWLSFLGRKNLVISPPGEGNSSEAPRWFYDTQNFGHEAKVALLLLRKLGVERAIFAGHSNGAVVATTMALYARKYGIEPAGLILLNPADIKRIHSLTGLYLSLLARFAISGFLLRLMHRKDGTPIQYLQKYFPPFKKPFHWRHLHKMFCEARKSSRGAMPSLLQFVRCPVICLFSRHDFVFPKWSFIGPSRPDIVKECVAPENLRLAEIDGLHNITLFKSAELAALELNRLLKEVGV